MREQSVKLEWSCFTPAQMPPAGRPEVAVIGRSNVGKSSLINAVLGQKGLMRVSNTPGRTRAVFFVGLDGKGFLVDLPGYGWAKVPLEMKRSWGQLVEAYLGRRPRGPALLLIDIRREPGEGDIQMAEWFRHYGRPFTVVMTKADKISRGQWKKSSDAIACGLDLDKEQKPVPFSAVTGEGVKSLRHLIEASME